MRSLFDRVAKFFAWVDTLEFIVPAVLAVLLLIGGPLLAIFFFLHNDHLFAAAMSAGLWILACLACVRDFRRARFSWASGSLIALWLILTIVIGWRLETM
jgi:hypothetical protein